MKQALVLAAVGETITGVTLLIIPSLIGRLLFGVDVTDVAATAVRVGGIALVGLGFACWPGAQLIGMVVYSAGVTFFLAYVGIVGGSAGVLLWPVVAVHAALTVFLIRPEVGKSKANT